MILNKYLFRFCVLLFRVGLGHCDEYTGWREYALFESTNRVSYDISLTKFESNEISVTYIMMT